MVNMLKIKINNKKELYWRMLNIIQVLIIMYRNLFHNYFNTAKNLEKLIPAKKALSNYLTSNRKFKYNLLQQIWNSMIWFKKLISHVNLTSKLKILLLLLLWVKLAMILAIIRIWSLRRFWVEISNKLLMTIGIKLSFQVLV